jgi:hypothetical protein
VITVNVDPGICGLSTEIQAETVDGQTVNLKLISSCPAIQAMGSEIMSVDGYAVAFAKFSESPIYQAAERHFKHAACPVPMAVIKAVEAACSVALPKNVEVTIEKDDT